MKQEAAAVQTPTGTAGRRVLRVRRADLPRGRRLAAIFGLFRFALYGVVGVASEVAFYLVVRVGRKIPGAEVLFRAEWHVDERLGLDAVWRAPIVALYGQCSLWMFVVYGAASFFFIEPIYRRLCRRPMVLRAVAYGAVILALEAASGHALRWLTGYAIWYYDDALAVTGMTSLYLGPIWMLTGLVVEQIYRELMDPEVRASIEGEISEAVAVAEAASGPGG